MTPTASYTPSTGISISFETPAGSVSIFIDADQASVLAAQLLACAGQRYRDDAKPFFGGQR